MKIRRLTANSLQQLDVVKPILVMLLEDVAKQAINRAPIARFGMMGDRLIKIVCVADYLAVIGVARNGAETVILRHIFQIILSEVSLDGRSLPIYKALACRAVRLWSIDFPVIISTYPDIGTLDVIWI